MSRGVWGRWLALALGALAAALLAYLNGGERVTLDLGVAVLYRIPLVALLLGSFLLGMLTMFLLGLRQDLRVRRVLREHGLSEQPRPRWSSPPPSDDSM